MGVRKVSIQLLLLLLSLFCCDLGPEVSYTRSLNQVLFGVFQVSNPVLNAWL